MTDVEKKRAEVLNALAYLEDAVNDLGKGTDHCDNTARCIRAEQLSLDALRLVKEFTNMAWESAMSQTKDYTRRSEW